MPRALSQILAELNPVYAPQKDLYNQQIGQLDPQMQAEQQGLEATKVDSFNQIQQGANRRGLNFSGIPLQEQASYTGQNFLPAVANLKAKYAQQRFNLQDAIAKINEEQYNKAYGIQGAEQDREAAERAARSAGGGGGGFGGFDMGGGGAPGAAPAGGKRKIVQRPGGGFNFQDAAGRAISAAVYSKQTGVPFRTLLQQMANAGDGGARSALGLVGNDFGYNRKAVSNQAQVNLLRALGLSNVGNYAAPQPANTRASGMQRSSGLVRR